MSKRPILAGVLAVTALLSSPAFANGLGENSSWQFQTSADKANQAAVQDMIQRKKSGYYAAPIYTTNIGHQYNCNVAATSQGNQGTNSTVANSPSTSGSSASSIGNSNATGIGGYPSGGSASSDQNNSGSVGSSVNGSTSTSVHGSASQALNSTQTNSGNQYANVQGSSACQFGALN